MRTATLKLSYDNVDISSDIAPCVLGFSYTDHAHGKADDLQITLEDRDQLWKNSWFPRKGAKLVPEIICQGWEEAGDYLSLKPGGFEIDDLGASGPPDTFTIKAVSSPITKSMRREKKTKAWEAVNLQAIAAEIAFNHSLTLFYEAEPVNFERVDQKEESDLAYLKRLCKENGLNLKISEEKVILFAGKDFEAKSSSFSFSKGSELITRYSLNSKAHDTYRACQVKYHVPAEKEARSYLYVPPNAPAVGQILKINRRVESLAAAMSRAQKELRAKNKDEVKGTLDLMGHPGLLAGLNIDLSGFGVFSGKYFIEEARHNQSQGTGYTTSVTVRKVLGY